MGSLKIAYISPEAVPYAKTGGLADVAGVLPEALSELGHDARLFMPLYSSIKRKKHGLVKLLENIPVRVASRDETFNLF